MSMPKKTARETERNMEEIYFCLNLTVPGFDVD